MVNNSDEKFSELLDQWKDGEELRRLNLKLAQPKTYDELREELRKMGYPAGERTNQEVKKYIEELKLDIDMYKRQPLSKAERIQDEWMMEQWKNNAKKTLKNGQPNNLYAQQMKSFDKWQNRKILNNPNPQFIIPKRVAPKGETLPERTIDLRVYTKGLRAIQEKRSLEMPPMGAKAEKDIKILAGQITGQPVPKGNALVRSIETDIQNAQKHHNGAALLQIRNRLLAMAEQPPDKRKVLQNSLDLNGLIEKANIAAKDYYARPGSSSKTNNELKAALDIGFRTDPTINNKLVNAGYTDIDKLNTKKELQAAAKKAGIGLRIRDMGKIDYISKIKEYDRRIHEEELTGLSLDALKTKFKNITGEVRHPITGKIIPQRKIYFTQGSDLPDTYGPAISLYKEKFGVEPSAKFIKQEEKRIALTRPYLSKPEIDKEIYRGISAKASTNTIPVARDLAVQRFMQFKYKNPKREPSANDLFEIARLKDKEYSAIIAKGVEKFKDPVTKITIKQKVLIPREIWKGTREPLMVDGEKQYKRPYTRNIMGPAGQIKAIEIKEPKYTNKFAIGGLKQQLMKEAEETKQRELEFIKEKRNTILKPILRQKETAAQIQAMDFIEDDLADTFGGTSRTRKELMKEIKPVIKDIGSGLYTDVKWDDVLKKVNENEKKSSKKKKRR